VRDVRDRRNVRVSVHYPQGQSKMSNSVLFAEDGSPRSYNGRVIYQNSLDGRENMSHSMTPTSSNRQAFNFGTHALMAKSNIRRNTSSQIDTRSFNVMRGSNHDSEHRLGRYESSNMLPKISSAKMSIVGMNNNLFQTTSNLGVKEVTEKIVTTNESKDGREIVTHIREEKKLVLENEPSVKSVNYDYNFNQSDYSPRNLNTVFDPRRRGALASESKNAFGDIKRSSVICSQGMRHSVSVSPLRNSNHIVEKSYAVPLAPRQS
jgi:hypothetical protein